MSTRAILPTEPDPARGIPWDVDYTSHPYLDPSVWDHPSRRGRWAEYTWRRIRHDDGAYRREAARLVRPLLDPRDASPPCMADVTRFAESPREADVDLHSAIRLLPAAARPHVLPLDEVTRRDDLRDLLGLVFTTGDPRRRFEAQRKVYLANLLLDIDQPRPIQDGPLHMTYFHRLLDDALWSHRQQMHEVEIGYRLDADGESVRHSSRLAPGDQVFTFRSSFLEWRRPGRTTTLDVLYANCRFKQSVLPVSFETVAGRQRVLEPERWSEMRQHRSGSVLSKMIRRGINDPSEIADLLGAMFIVYDEDGVGDLLEMIDAGLGNPFGWRNVTDSLGPVATGAGLNPHAGRGYQVFKGDVDILMPGGGSARPPYRFTVKFQVHTLESFLRTICTTHRAEHRDLKLRQFLMGLVPYLFPAAVYGTDWLHLGTGS
jgi:hypothetical protein